jgi:hypothetical protein
LLMLWDLKKDQRLTNLMESEMKYMIGLKNNCYCL